MEVQYSYKRIMGFPLQWLAFNIKRLEVLYTVSRSTMEENFGIGTFVCHDGQLSCYCCYGSEKDFVVA